MEEKERIRLKEFYENMSDRNLIEKLSDRKEDFKEGVYEIISEEAKKRGIEGKLTEEKELKEKYTKIMGYASTSKRFLNYTLDYFIMMGLSFAFFTLLALTGLYPQSLLTFLKEGGQAAEYIVGILIFIFYYFIFESIYQRTPAKFITKTKVLDISGAKPTKMQILKRSLSRLMPFEPFSGFGGGTPWHGWHDRWSHTMVVASNFPELNQVISLQDEKIIPKVNVEKKMERKTKRCPYCDEEIPYEAIKCQYCKEFLNKTQEN